MKDIDLIIFEGHKIFTMKKIGLITLVIGVIVSVFAGFHYKTRENIIDTVSMHMMTNNHHTMDWLPYLGISIILIGAAIYLIGSKNKKV